MKCWHLTFNLHAFGLGFCLQWDDFECMVTLGPLAIIYGKKLYEDRIYD